MEEDVEFTRPASWKMKKEDFFCIVCEKLPPPLSPAMSNTTRPFVICTKNHIVCHACYVRQVDYNCKGCGNREPLTHLDVFLQPSYLIDFYNALVSVSYFECGRLCGETFKGGKALLEHEQECKFDPPCVCPHPNCHFEFQWPKTPEERKVILEQHGQHLRFSDSSSFPLFIEEIYNENTGDYYSMNRAVVFKPTYDYIDRCPNLRDATTLRKVERLCKIYPPVAVWIDYRRSTQTENAGITKMNKFVIRAKWLQRNSRIIPDGSYEMDSRLASFHTYQNPNTLCFTINPLKALSKEFYETYFAADEVPRTFKQEYTPCTICKYRKKHYHMTNYIYNKAISVCKTRYDI